MTAPADGARPLQRRSRGSLETGASKRDGVREPVGRLATLGIATGPLEVLASTTTPYECARNCTVGVQFRSQFDETG